MARSFRSVDRDQLFLLPVDMREWLPADHLVWFVLDVVEEFDLSGFVGRYRLGGVGREAFDPRVMVALLAYAYCHGVRSSRQIERACVTDVAFRVLCGQRVPDHSVICRFRSVHAEALADLFGQVLVMCARAGLGRVGVVAIDGTKIAANASVDRNRSREWFRAEAARMIADAEAVDAGEDAAEAVAGGPGDRLAPRWRDRSGRRDRIRAALGEIDAYQGGEDEPVREADERAERARGEYERVRAERAVRLAEQEARAAGERAAGERAAGERAAGERAAGERTAGAAGPVGPARARRLDPSVEGQAVERARRRAERAERQAAAARQRWEAAGGRKANATDPQSRVMKTRQGWVQGFNSQTAVSEDGIILAHRTSNAAVDIDQFVPIMNAAVAAAAMLAETAGVAAGVGGRIETIVADAGYFSEHNLQADGPDRLIAAGKKHRFAERKARTTAGDPRRQTCTDMIERLRQPDTEQLYRRRGAIVEPVNGHLKDRRRLRRYARRGLAAAAAEFGLAAWTTNLMKIYTRGLATG